MLPVIRGFSGMEMYICENGFARSITWFRVILNEDRPMTRIYSIVANAAPGLNVSVFRQTGVLPWRPPRGGWGVRYLGMMSLLLLFLFPVIAAGQSPSFRSYMNPVIPGDHPDCTLTRIGDHFYTTGSSFNVTPVIWHSTDLVHWEAIAQPVSAAWSGYGDSPGGGCWGGQMVYYNGQYWHFFSRGNTMHYVKANAPEGPWGTPVRINNPAGLPYGLGYDNSVFIDDDNRWYLVVKNGQPNNGIVELGANGQPAGALYDLKWLNPGPSYPYAWAEGPVMWKYGGYYYYSFARDLAGGQKVMRSQTLTADQSAWTMLGDFFNEGDPNKGGSLFTSPNHASAAVMLDDSTSWVIHPLYAKGEWKGQGRQGLLNQVRYNTAGRPVADYPVNKFFEAPRLRSSGIPWGVPVADDFDGPKLHPGWSFLGQTTTQRWSLSERPGWLRLSPKSTSKAMTVIQNDGEHNYALVTRLEFDPQVPADGAGLRIMRGDETLFVKLFVTRLSGGEKGVVFSYDQTRHETVVTSGDTVWLKMVRVNHKVSGYFSADGVTWSLVGSAVDVSAIDSYSDFSSFTGTRQGLFVEGNLSAWFDLYLYRDAFTPILAECPANLQGVTRTAPSQGISNLDNISAGDWALYAGVAFGDGELYPPADSVLFEAACLGAGGNIEVWLDSLDTGRKIGECTVTASGGWNSFRSFSAPLERVTGTHDLYLKFMGGTGVRLFILRWITFTRKPTVTSAAGVARPGFLNGGSLKLYPNPSAGEVHIEAGFPFHTLEIFTLKGERLFLEQGEAVTRRSLVPPVPSGAYVVRVTGKNGIASALMVVGR